MQIILNDTECLNCILNKDLNSQHYRFYAKTMLESLIDGLTLQTVKQYNIELLSIFNIGSKSMLYYRDKKRKLYTPEFFLNKALKGKPISYFMVSGKDYSYFNKIEAIELTLDEGIDNKKYNKINKKLLRNAKKTKITAHKKMSGYRARLNMSFACGAVETGKKNLAFLSRYNNEIFGAHIFMDSRRLSAEEVNAVYETRKQALDLTDLRIRNAFIALYGITRKYFSFSDVYSVDGVFSLSENRTLDEKKKAAASDVFFMFLTGVTPAVLSPSFTDDENDEFYLQPAGAMNATYATPACSFAELGRALLEIEIPPLDIDDVSLIQHNYTLYAGLADIGEMFSSLDSNISRVKDYAEKLCGFSLYAEYYDMLVKNSDYKDVTKAKIYAFEKSLNCPPSQVL